MSRDIRHLVGRNVRRLRCAAEITQAQLAAEMEVDRSYVSGLELGQRNPTILTLWYLAQALRTHPRAFFEEGQGPGKEGPNEPRRAVPAAVRGAGGSKAPRAKKAPRER